VLTVFKRRVNPGQLRDVVVSFDGRATYRSRS
jgi:hypothetical protein